MNARATRARTPCRVLVLIVIALAWGHVHAQKPGGILKAALRENPSSASLHEETSIMVNTPFMAVFNNLVLFDQQDRMARLESIKPELATGWSWSADNKTVTFKLREGVKWHDGKPFTSEDVKCTWDMITERRPSNWRKNVRKEWYQNLKEVSVHGPYEVRFTLERSQPSFMAMLATGSGAVYPCHVDGRVMRQKPIGTGPFKVVDFKPNDVIRLARNTDYWKPGLPYLDGIEHRIIPSQSTRTLSFVSGQVDITGPGDVSPAILKDIKSQVPKAVCETYAGSGHSSVLINHKAPQMQDPRVRRAVSLALDRRLFVAAQHGHGRMGGVMMSPPYGVWGLTPEQLDALPGFGKDVEKNRAEARKLMEEAGYGPNKKLKLTYMARLSSAPALLGASMVADQLRTIYIEGEIEQKEYTIYTGAIMKGAYTMIFHSSGVAFDDPDIVMYENFMCNSPRNFTKYCNKDVEAKIHEQSATLDIAKRKELVQELDIMLQRDAAKVLLYQTLITQCWHPHVKGVVKAANSNYTHNRMEHVWIDK
jgi:peptide/nickel transport system substrate-binding protein